MGITFRRAIREQIGLIIGVAGSSGSGKTMSAMRLAAGISGGKPFAVIDTERGRAKHYAEQFTFDHADLNPPFRPSSYAEAIEAADKAGYPVIVVDSCSHEHAGDGGLLDWHEEELDRMAGDDWKKRDACNMAAWVKPKMEHKSMMSSLLRVKAHVILCFRAEQKVEMVRKDGKMDIQPKRIASGFSDWIPICEKSMLYELTNSFLLTPEAPGIGKPIKLQEQHKPFFPSTQHLDELAGKRLAEWASGSEREGGADGLRTSAAACDVPPVQSHPPSNSDAEPSGIVCDFAANIDDVQDMLSAQRTWDEIVKCQDMTSKQRAGLFKRYQDKVKSLK